MSISSGIYINQRHTHKISILQLFLQLFGVEGVDTSAIHALLLSGRSLDCAVEPLSALFGLLKKSLMPLHTDYYYDRTQITDIIG